MGPSALSQAMSHTSLSHSHFYVFLRYLGYLSRSELGSKVRQRQREKRNSDKNTSGLQSETCGLSSGFSLLCSFTCFS